MISYEIVCCGASALMKINKHEFQLKAQSNEWRVRSPYVAHKIERQTATPISHATNGNKEINYSHWNRIERIPLTEAFICQIWTEPKRQRQTFKSLTVTPTPLQFRRSSFGRICIVGRKFQWFCHPQMTIDRSINSTRKLCNDRNLKRQKKRTRVIISKKYILLFPSFWMRCIDSLEYNDNRSISR